MDFDRITLKQLRFFTATMEEGSILAASRKLHVTGPAISMQLKALEEIVGMSLYERSRSGLKATAVGRELQVTASRIDSTLGAFDQAVSFISEGEVGRVTLGAVSTAKYFVPSIVAAFNELYPSVDISLQVGNREEIIRALESHKIDFAIMGRPPEGMEYEKVVISEHPQVFIAPPDHPLAERKRIKISSLADEKFLLREEGSGTRTIFQDLLNESGMPSYLGTEFGSNETIKQSVMAGIGIALLSAHTVSAEVNDGRLVVLNVKGTPVIRYWFIVKQVEKMFMPLTERIWRFIAAEGDEIIARLNTPAGN